MLGRRRGGLAELDVRNAKVAVIGAELDRDRREGVPRRALRPTGLGPDLSGERSAKARSSARWASIR